jgi:hypothetical protein
LIVPFATSVFAIFLLRQFFLSIPQELYDAAQMDGCSRFGFPLADCRPTRPSRPDHRGPAFLPWGLEFFPLAAYYDWQ